MLRGLLDTGPTEAAVAGACECRTLVLDDITALPLYLQSSLAQRHVDGCAFYVSLRVTLSEPSGTAFRGGRLARRLLHVLTAEDNRRR